MVIIEQLTVEQRLERLEKYFKNHYHDSRGGSTPKFETYCPECGSIEDAIKIEMGLWECSTCGHTFNGDDCSMWYCGDQPMTMPRGKLP
jgi:hypothetical protein